MKRLINNFRQKIKNTGPYQRKKKELLKEKLQKRNKQENRLLDLRMKNLKENPYLLELTQKNSNFRKLENYKRILENETVSKSLNLLLKEVNKLRDFRKFNPEQLEVILKEAIKVEGYLVKSGEYNIKELVSKIDKYK